MFTDSTTGAFHSDPEKLERLFAIALDNHRHYSPSELGAILEHQLSARVDFDLSTLDPGIRRLLQAASTCGETGGVSTFRQLFNHPHPPIHLLHLTKTFAKNHLKHPESPLPPEIATVLYYTSIATAWLKLHKRISELSSSSLSDGLAQVLGFPWLDHQLRTLLTQGESSLSGWHIC